MSKNTKQLKPLQVKLTDEEVEALEFLVNSEGFSVLLHKVAPSFIRHAKDRLFSQAVQDQDSLLQLSITKSEVNGMQQLLNELEALKGRSKQD